MKTRDAHREEQTWNTTASGRQAGSSAHASPSPLGAARDNPPAPETADPGPPHAGTPTDAGGVAHRFMALFGELVGPDRVRMLFGDRAGVSCVGDVIEVCMPDRFSAEMLERRFGAQLRRAAEASAPGCAIGVTLRVASPENGASPRSGEHAAPDKAPAPNAEVAIPGRGRPAQRVEDHPLGVAPASARQRSARANEQAGRSRQGVPEYIVGEPNRVAFEACRRTAGETDAPEIVFVHGPCGVGKTHLLRTAGSIARRANPNARIRLTTGEGFIGGFVKSSLEKSVTDFQRKHRRLDLLIIDDIQVIAGKEGTQQELVRTLSELQLAGSRVILASDAHPREIARLQAALASRFVSGVVAPVGRPDEDMVRRLIPALAKRRGLALDPRGLDLLTNRVLEDDLATVRDIEGTLTQVQAVGNLMDSDRALFLSAEHVRRAVEMRAGERRGIRSGPVNIETIIGSTCDELGVTKGDLAGSGRAKKVVLARELIVHLGKRHTGKSYPELAMAIGRPNHSTVITAHNRFRAKVESGEPIRVGSAVDGCAPGELVGRIERSMGV